MLERWGISPSQGLVLRVAVKRGFGLKASTELIVETDSEAEPRTQRTIPLRHRDAPMQIAFSKQFSMMHEEARLGPGALLCGGDPRDFMADSQRNLHAARSSMGFCVTRF